MRRYLSPLVLCILFLAACGSLQVGIERTPTPVPLPTPTPVPGFTPTRPPVLYRPTGWPTDVLSLLDCMPQADTDEACLDDGRVRLGEGAGGTVAIQNYHSRDMGWPPIDRPAPSLYCVEIVPILRKPSGYQGTAQEPHI